MKVKQYDWVFCLVFSV